MSKPFSTENLPHILQSLHYRQREGCVSVINKFLEITPACLPSYHNPQTLLTNDHPLRPHAMPYNQVCPQWLLKPLGLEAKLSKDYMIE